MRIGLVYTKPENPLTKTVSFGYRSCECSEIVWTRKHREPIHTNPNPGKSDRIKIFASTRIHRFLFSFFVFIHPHQHPRTNWIWYLPTSMHKFSSVSVYQTRPRSDLIAWARLHSNEERFRRTYSLVSCGRKADSHTNICVFKNIWICVDGVSSLQNDLSICYSTCNIKAILILGVCWVFKTCVLKFPAREI